MGKFLVVLVLLLGCLGCAVPSTSARIEIPVPLFKELNGLPINKHDYKMNNIVLEYSNKWFSRDVTFTVSRGENGLYALNFHSLSDPSAAAEVSQLQVNKINDTVQAALVAFTQLYTSGAIQPSISRTSNVNSGGIILTKDELLSILNNGINTEKK